ncbi:lipoprotein [Spiroplasma endosymbiont of Cantharis nigra]|uniref:lipoprotein n=1 Tax=Spiroplasma endosymbiont of Cantharis nigra TaxID=3066278 RepID=UPI0030CA8F36
MRKLLTILGTVTLVASSSFSVIACNNPGPDPVIKKDLTDELLKEFVNEIGEINYEGPFIFEEGYKINDGIMGTSSILGHLALEQFYDLINEKFNYKDYSFIHATAETLNQEINEIKNNVKYTFDISFTYRSNNEFNEAKNDWLNFKFNFTQTQKYENEKYLDNFFNSTINKNFYKNNKGMSTSWFKEVDIFQSLNIKVTTDKLNQLKEKQDKLDELTKELEISIKKDENDQKISILNLVNINVVNFNLLDENDKYYDLYSLNLVISLKDNKSIFLEKEINTRLYKK